MPRTEPIKAVRGVHDLLPQERALWRTVEIAATRVARSFGYQEIVTPIIEHAELIERVGEDTDAVAKELYRFEDRGGRQVALRPEATAGIVRAYFEGHLNQGPQPARLFLIGPMFRYNRPQKGRYRQFFQFDVEAIGAESPAVDAEVIELAATWLHELGLRDLRLDLNSIGDAKCRPAYLDLLRAYYRPLKAELHGECQRRLETNPLLLLDCKVPQCQPFKAKAPRVTDHLCDECAAAWEAVRRLLHAAGIEYRLDPHLVRGLDYYTRTAFEFVVEAIGAQSSIAGGGRYDGLIEQLGGKPTPGIGFGAGVERLLLSLEAAGVTAEEQGLDVFLALHEAELKPRVMPLVTELRRQGLRAEVDHGGRSLKGQLTHARRLGAATIIEWGLERSVVRRPGQPDEEVPTAELVERLKQ